MFWQTKRPIFFRQLSLRRAGGEPLAYIVGSKAFFGLTLQVDARVLVLVLIPFSLVILLQKVTVANHTQFGSELESILKSLPMLPQRSSTKVRFREQGEAIGSQIVEPFIFDSPGIVGAIRLTGNSEEVVAFVFEVSAEADTTLAEVVRRKRPFGSIDGLVAKHLVRIPIDVDLRTEDSVVTETYPINIERWFRGVGRRHRPIEDRHASHIRRAERCNSRLQARRQ